MEKQENKGEIIIYKAQDGPEFRVNFENDTVWLTEAQTASLFGVNVPAVVKHAKNIINAGELTENRTISKMEIVQTEGNREVKRRIEVYNLDMILSIGYRVNSKKATQFRVWATQTLKDYLLKGYLINEKRLRENQNAKLRELQQAHVLIQQALESKRLDGFEKELLNIITDYTNTWVILNDYDSGKLKISDVSKKKATYLEYEKIKDSIGRFKKRLMSSNEASELFGAETGHKLQQLLGSIRQSFDAVDLYPSREEKAAHLFYFSIKDHPFVDGNKRIGSLMFILFLVDNNILYNRKGERRINDSALAALALLVAESKPSQKDVMIKLVVNLINKK